MRTVGADLPPPVDFFL
uniref:Uncharacterized protein n=1 Tax=Arundo donax TaxID=35708 RepID=A0A0A9C6E7_ARUDO